MADLEKIAEELSSLTVIEAADLSKLLEEKWGVSAAAPVAVAAAPGAAGEAGGVAEEKDEFDVIYESNRKTVPHKQSQLVEEQHPNLKDKKGKIKMAGKKNSLGNELTYFENDKQYKGVHLDNDYNLFAAKRISVSLVNCIISSSLINKISVFLITSINSS